MKLKAIASIFKKNKFLRIWNAPSGSQWITNGVAVYSMEGMPKLTPAMVLKIFDIPEDKQTEWNCEVVPMPADMCKICTDYRALGAPLEPKKTTIQCEGITHLFLSGSEGEILAINEKYIKPLYDDMDYLQLYKSKLERGFAVSCYNGLEVAAVIMPIRVGGTLAEELLEIAKYLNSRPHSSTYEDIVKHSRPAMNVDPETGEILDESSDYEQEMLERGADNNG